METVVFENDRVKVTHVSMDVDETVTDVTRGDRVLIFLDDSDHERADDGGVETQSRRRLDVVWREASTHTVKNVDVPQELMIVELKS